MAMVDLTILVYDLSPNITKADLTTFFSYCGTVDSIDLSRIGGESRSATVTFKQPYAQQTALLLNNATILDRPVRILPGRDNTDKTQEETESMATTQSVLESLRSTGYGILRTADEAVGKAGSACLTAGALWISGLLDKASQCTAQVADVNKEKEGQRGATISRKRK